MNIVDLLNNSGESSIEELKNRFEARSIINDISIRTKDLVDCFTNGVERTIMNIVNDEIANSYGKEKIIFSNEAKSELIKFTGEKEYEKLNVMKDNLDSVFGGSDSTEEPKKEVEITITKVQPDPAQIVTPEAATETANGYFGY